MNPQVEMEWCALWRALDGVSERLLRASEDATLSELRGLRTELAVLARQALQTPAAQPAGTSTTTENPSTTTGKTSATTENPIAATGISIAATEKAPRPSSVRALALARAAVALRSTFPPDETLIASLTEAAAREIRTCLPDSRKALALAYLHAATYADRWRRASDGLLRHLPADALTHEARALLASLEVAV